MRVLVFGTYNENAHPRVRVLREGLSLRGHEVTVCNVPLRFDTADRVRLAQQPWRIPVFLVLLAVAWLRLLWRSRRCHRPDVVLVGYLGAFDIHLARLRYPKSVLAYDQMVSISETIDDRTVRSQGSMVHRLARRIDSAAQAAADLVLVDTGAQADRVPGGHRVLTVPVGAPSAWMAIEPSPLPKDDEAVRVVFFGLYTPLQGAATIGAALSELPDGAPLEVTMVGDGQDRTAAEDAAARTTVPVRWVDWVESDDLPALVARHHVCLGIFGTSDKADRVIPNKVFQAAAAGAAIVTSDTPEQRAALGSAAVLVPAGDPDALASALDELARDRNALEAARTAARQWAETHCDPRMVVADLEKELETLARGGTGDTGSRHGS